MKKEKKKPNCYTCKWRGDVPGSAHSCCKHPSLRELTENPFLQLISILGGVRGGLPPMTKEGAIKVKGNPIGIRNGWFNHPFNFDPVWLEECSGYEPKDKKKMIKKTKP